MSSPAEQDDIADTIRQVLARPSQKAFARVSRALACAFAALTQLAGDLHGLEAELAALECRVCAVKLHRAPELGPDGQPIRRGRGRPKGAEKWHQDHSPHRTPRPQWARPAGTLNDAPPQERPEARQTAQGQRPAPHDDTHRPAHRGRSGRRRQPAAAPETPRGGGPDRYRDHRPCRHPARPRADQLKGGLNCLLRNYCGGGPFGPFGQSGESGKA